MNTEEVLPYPTHDAMLSDLVIADRPLTSLIDEIQKLYLNDARPWIIGFSGGKDSTVVLSLVFAAIEQLDEPLRQKPVYVVSSNTLVETPVVVDQVSGVIDTINTVAKQRGLNFSAHSVYPRSDQTFWVNLLGRGYPAPSTTFRWCTERMKINPVSEFITERVMEFGEVIVVLGSRSQESSSRAQVIARHRIDGSALSRHTSLPNAYTYMPVESWSADDVWEYLMSSPCPWGGSNRNLFDLYKGSNQGECPLVIDKSTPSCGNSRFGCWTCTVVTEDKAIHGLIESGADWMKPLLNFRNKLHQSRHGEDAAAYRNYKRRTGLVTFDTKDKETTEKKLIRGPYWLKYRKQWLQELLEIEKSINSDGHEIELITREELQLIRKEWLKDPNEPDWEDSLPRIFAEIYPDEAIQWIENDAGVFTKSDTTVLKELGAKYQIPAEMVMKLIEVEIAQSSLARRKGVLAELEKVLQQDWDSLETVSRRYHEQRRPDTFEGKLQELRSRYDDIDRYGP